MYNPYGVFLRLFLSFLFLCKCFELITFADNKKLEDAWHLKS